MTISTDTNRDEFDGNDTTVAFPTSFVFFDETDLVVLLVTDATGVSVTQTLTTHYTVAGGGGATGTVTMVTAPATGETLVVYRDVPYTQESAYITGSSFPADTLELDLDRVAARDQQLAAAVERAARLPESDTSGADVTLPAPSASKALGWNAAAGALQNISLTAYELAAGVSEVINAATYADLDVALADIGSDVRTLVIGSSFSAPSTTTVPSTLSLWFVGDGQLSVASGKTVTISGPVQAPIKQIFSGSGTVASGAGPVGWVYPEWWGAAGDGTTDDSTAFLSALEFCRTRWNAGAKTALRLSNRRYRISYTKSGSADPFDDSSGKSFYDFDNTWDLFSEVSGGSIENRAFLIISDGAMLLPDGDDNSWFLTSSQTCAIDLRGQLTVRAYDETATVHCFSFEHLAYATWYSVDIQNFYNGIGLNVWHGGERNEFYGLHFNYCQRALILGRPGAVTYASIEGNENRFYGLEIYQCGYSLSHPECLENGFLEIHYSQAPVFVGGTWKTNKNALLIRAAENATFMGVYFEYNGFAVGGGAFPGEGGTPEVGYRNHVIFDSANNELTDTTAAPILNVSFINCFFGAFCRILFNPDSGQEIKGVRFQDCQLNDQVYFHYVSGNEAYTNYITLDSLVFATPSTRATLATAPPAQYPIDLGDGTAGSVDFTALDITMHNPGFRHNRYSGATEQINIDGGLKIGNNNSSFIKNVISAASALDFPSISAGAEESLTITVTGAAVGDFAGAAHSGALEAGVAIKSVYVSATNTVTITLYNYSGSPVNPANNTWRAFVVKF